MHSLKHNPSVWQRSVSGCLVILPEVVVKLRSKTQAVPPGSKLRSGLVVAPAASAEASRLGEGTTEAPRKVIVKLLKASVDLLMIDTAKRLGLDSVPT